MVNNNRFLLISICFMIVVVVPWRTETILPAEIVGGDLSEPAKKTHLHCTASVRDCLEISAGQDAVFFPDTDRINPFYISVQKLGFSKKTVQISGSPLKGSQHFDGTIKGLISIKGDRKSLIMRAYSYFFHS
jgi:hypothetical protein